MPEDRHLIIDSKVSLNAYERYVSAETEAEKQKALAEHIKAFKDRVDELAAKNYSEIYAINSLDFVIMYSPIEAAYLTAIQNDPNLLTYAFDRKVVIISPTNLFAILKTVETLWRLDYQNKNVRDIAVESGKLYDKIAAFVEDLKNIGKKIDDAKAAFEKAENKLYSGRGNVLGKIEKIRKLGAAAKKKLSDEVLLRISDETEDAD